MRWFRCSGRSRRKSWRAKKPSLDKASVSAEAFFVHILSVTQPIELLNPSDQIVPGTYLVDDINAGQLMVFAKGAIVRPPGDAELFNVATEAGEGSTLFMRAGGFGDLLLLAPVLRQYKNLYPDEKIAVSCFAPYAAVLDGLPYVDEILPYPLPLEQAHKWKRWVWLENAVEGNPRAQELHMTLLFAEMAGVSMVGADMAPDYRVKASEALWANQKYPRGPKKRAAIQIKASAPSRTYPLGLTADVARQLIGRGYEVFLMGARGDLPPKKADVADLHDLVHEGLTFRESCAVLNTCDVVIAPDSALLHVAGALKIPAVGLYAAFPWKLRTQFSPKTHSLRGIGECAPCFHHANQARQNHFPKHCPTKDLGFCGVLSQIKPAEVVATAEQIARDLPPAHAL